MARSKSGKSRRRSQIRHRHKRQRKGMKARIPEVAQNTGASS